MRYLGLDVHSEATVYCLLDAEGNELERGKVATSASALQQLVQRPCESEPLTVGQEVGTMCHFVHDTVRREGSSAAQLVVDAQGFDGRAESLADARTQRFEGSRYPWHTAQRWTRGKDANVGSGAVRWARCALGRGSGVVSAAAGERELGDCQSRSALARGDEGYRRYRTAPDDSRRGRMDGDCHLCLGWRHKALFQRERVVLLRGNGSVGITKWQFELLWLNHETWNEVASRSHRRHQQPAKRCLDDADRSQSEPPARGSLGASKSDIVRGCSAPG